MKRGKHIVETVVHALFLLFGLVAVGCVLVITVYLVISYIPLVPGGGAYYTMEYLVGGETQLAMETGIHTLFVAGAIAMGIVLVSSMTRILAAYGRRRREKQESSESA